MSIWDAIEQAAYTGLGLAALTKEKLDEAVDTLKKERGLTENEGRHLAEQLKDNAESAKRNLDEVVHKAVEKTLSRMNLATRGELERLEKRIRELEAATNVSTGDSEGLNSADSGNAGLGNVSGSEREAGGRPAGVGNMPGEDASKNTESRTGGAG